EAAAHGAEVVEFVVDVPRRVGLSGIRPQPLALVEVGPGDVRLHAPDDGAVLAIETGLQAAEPSVAIEALGRGVEVELVLVGFTVGHLPVPAPGEPPSMPTEVEPRPSRPLDEHRPILDRPVISRRATEVSRTGKGCTS